MPRNRPDRVHTLAYAVVIAAIIALAAGGAYTYKRAQAALTTRHLTPPDDAALELLRERPTLGASGTRYDIIIDLECPYCSQFLATEAFARILNQAQNNQARLNVTAAALLNNRSRDKGSLYNCVARHAGPEHAIALLPTLKTPGSNANEARAQAQAALPPRAGANIDNCINAGAEQRHANDAYHASGARGVPAVFVDGTPTLWTELNPTN